MRVSLFQHSQEHGTPDAVFPNNWFSTHPQREAAGGVKPSTLVYYPLKCPNRCCSRPAARLDLLCQLVDSKAGLHCICAYRWDAHRYTRSHR